MKFSKKRGIVVGLIFLSVIVGLVLHTGTGTESAIGWRDIALICPVGSLEVLAGSRGLGLHTVLLLVAVLVISVLLGKSFCSWACPTAYVRSLFGVRQGKGGSDAQEGNEESESGDAAGADGEDTAAQGRDELSPSVQVVASGEDAILASDDAAATVASEDAGEGAGAGEQDAEGAALPPVGGERDGKRIDSRHAVLVGAIASSFVFGFPVFCLICPVGLTFGIVIGLFNLIRYADATWSLLVFPLILVLELVVFRKWCTHLCPISALLSLLSRRGRVVRPKVKTDVCLRSHGDDCHTCVETCPEKVDPHSKDIPECSNCGLCVDACPAKAIAMKLGAYSKNLEDK
ncbi:MAG: 4Fe-4S binding protein [Coriobacteriales bacterium]|jgi:ferredoxin-type protein NapH